MHILPARFVKIRHYGLLANRGRVGRIERARELIGEPPAETPPAQAETPTEAANVKPQLTCVHCGSVRLRLLAVIQPMRFSPKSPTPADTS